MTLALPDCRHHEERFALTAEERRELVRRIAEDGPGAIDAFIREREKEDSLIARKVQKLRDELLKRAEELKRRLSGEFAAKAEALDTAYTARLAELDGDRARLQADMGRLSASADSRLDAALRAMPIGLALDADLSARPPWWRRALRWLARALRILLWPLLWLLRLVTPRRARREKRIVFATPAAGRLLSRAGDLYLTDARVRGAVKARLRSAPPTERFRRAWERLLGREDYESLAQKAMNEMLAEEAERAEQKADASRRALQEAIDDVESRRRDALSERSDAARRLREEADEEAKRIERALREAPERDVKEAIVDELRAAGLLRAQGESLVPTLQLIDRFAALVYDEEMRGSRGGRGASPGDYSEGEGAFLRGPIRSAAELSRMDIPATLLRARSRHPHVRHLFDDDVVIHREERESLAHVILVLDRSGSMEEHGRMDAARRAALALHHSVKARNPRNVVDILLMDTSVSKATVREAWDATPRGFTNTGAALRMARKLLAARRLGRGLVYLVTDGLPEAYTKDGEDVAGHPKRAMRYAKDEARLLAREPTFAGLVMLLLEPEDEMYTKAASELAEEGKGRVVPVDPNELTRALVRSFETGPVKARAQPA